MALTEEEQRALAYREQARRRLLNERARRRGLAGSRTERAALTERWRPLREWLTERRG